MIFTEPRYLAFFAIAFAVHWLLPGKTARKLWLLAASFFFYGVWNWRFIPLLLGITFIDYFAGRVIVATRSQRVKDNALLLSLSANLTLLFLFKYFGFFVASAVTLIRVFGARVDAPLLDIIIPLGISFHTFQAMAYTIDVYQGRARPARSVLDFALFVTFFPQLVAGPVVRAKDFLPALEIERRLQNVEWRRYLTLFLFGFFKKACVSDNIAPFVDRFYQAPQSYSSLSAWAAIFLYSIQIYCDFSGYTDMAIASSGLLGFDLPPNFRQPYLSANIQDFWRRWHISMSQWFRDYVYIPLGGNRSASEFVIARNLLITAFLSGLWHGANWKFVAWGLAHGVSLIAHRWWTKGQRTAARAYNILFTFSWVTLLWVLFRAETFTQAIAVYRRCFDFTAEGARALGDQPLFILICYIVAAHFMLYRLPYERWITRWKPVAYSAAAGAAYAVVFALANGNYLPFIYFQF